MISRMLPGIPLENSLGISFIFYSLIVPGIPSYILSDIPPDPFRNFFRDSSHDPFRYFALDSFRESFRDFFDDFSRNTWMDSFLDYSLDSFKIFQLHKLHKCCCRNAVLIMAVRLLGSARNERYYRAAQLRLPCTLLQSLKDQLWIVFCSSF